MCRRRTILVSLVCAAVLLSVTAGTGSARDRRPAFQGIMVDEADPPPKRAGKPARVNDAAGPKRSEKRRAAKPRPRGSSTYIPPSPSVLAPGPGVYQPPRRDTFGDRVTNCIHAAPLASGIGNNPADRQAFVRQCAN
jgi:hypothetical protein